MKKNFSINDQIAKQLQRISPRQMERRLQKLKVKVKRRIYGGTKPETLLKHQIPIKTDHWDVKEPGFTEIDTVSHSGNCASGEFAYSVNQTDILTGWVETRAAIVEKVKLLEKMNQLLVKSSLTEEDSNKYGRMIKTRQWKKTKTMLK
ncbi:hypothetical protein HZC34_01780 [Candidatus Saganbacteria bacterium]|nr:hypothetical protein [Candidatus Saganbacteria bacterium]